MCDEHMTVNEVPDLNQKFDHMISGVARKSTLSFLLPFQYVLIHLLDIQEINSKYIKTCMYTGFNPIKKLQFLFPSN